MRSSKDDLIRQAFDAETFRQAGHELIDLLADFLAETTSGRAPQTLAWMPPEQQLQYWQDDFAQQRGTAPHGLFAKVLAHSIRVQHPRYMGHQISPAAPIAALGSLVDGFLNNGMGVYEMGQAGTALERLVIRQLADQMELGPQSDGVLTSGGTLANLTALLAARSAKAPSPVWEAGQQEPLALLVSEEAHYCVDRAARIMGWGAAGIIKVPADAQYRLRAELLPEYTERARQQGLTPIAVVGSACSTSTGSFDDLSAIADFCAAQGLWFHVDAAHGGALAFSAAHRHLLAGLERADSVAMDFHKMLLVPSITTALLFREGSQAFHTFSQRAQYLWNRDADEEWHNMAKRTFECTKLMMSLKVYALLRTYGPELWEQYLDRVMSLGQAFAAQVRAAEDFELAVEPQCNIVCFRYRPPALSEEALNALNETILQAVVKDGRFYIVKTNLRGKFYLRVTLSNPFTTPAHIGELLESISAVVQRAV
jgi:L-2,4-diaminobutyrate decarboxylase